MAAPPFFSRFAVWILLGFAVAAPLVFYSAVRAVRTNSNRVADWLPSTFTETGEFVWFRKHFVSDQFVVVSWDGCRLGGDPSKADAEPDDPRIELLAKTLVPDAAPDSAPSGGASGYQRFFHSVLTARRVLTELTSPPSSVPYDDAVQRLTTSLIGLDGRQTCLMVMMTDEAVEDLRGTIGRGEAGLGVLVGGRPGALFQALNECGIDTSTVRIGGPAVDSVAIDEEGERTLFRLAGLSVLLGLGLAWWSLRSVKLTLIVFVCGILSAALSLALVWLTGATMDAVMLSMPSMVYVLAISGSVHIINYYRDAVIEGGLQGAPDRAIAHGWKPALLCSVTTALGLASLYASELVPIQKFGMYSALGVMGMLIILFLYLPAALQIWPLRLPRRDTRHMPKSGSAASAEHDGWLDRFWAAFGRWVIRRHGWVLLVCVAVIVTVGIGLSRVRTSIDLLKLFNSEARILQDYAWLEEHLGRLVPMEIVLRFPAQTQAAAVETDAAEAAQRFSMLERMESVALVQRTLEDRFGAQGQDVISRPTSAVTFAPPLPDQGGDMRSYVVRSMTNGRMEAGRDAFARSGYLRIDPADGSELWRISIRVAAFKDVDYGRFVEALRQAIDPILAAHAERNRILSAIVARRGGAGYAGATVCLWDASRQGPETAASLSQEQRDYSAALRELLVRARLRVLHTAVEPLAIPLTRLERLRHLDRVVLLDGLSEADRSLIEVSGAIVDDARLESAAKLLPQAAGASAHKSPTISVIYTGVVPIVYKAQRVLLNSLIESTFWSFITITPLLMLVSRSISAGAVVMIPNVLPVLIVFGGMGWLGIAVDIGSMMSASIALGVAVDDTIHFMSWYRQDLERLGDRKAAILAAYRRCATPTLQAALISGLGLSVFAFSTFTPTQRFGCLMLTILIAGMVAELVMLPALLASPLGRVFRSSRTPKETTDSAALQATPANFVPESADVQRQRKVHDEHRVPHGSNISTEPAMHRHIGTVCSTTAPRPPDGRSVHD